MNGAYEPKGVRFYDCASQRELLLVGEGEAMAGWLCYHHPDGHWWVTLRQATQDDIDRIADAPYFATTGLLEGE